MNNSESTKKYLEKLKEQASIKPVEERKNKSVHGLLNLLDALDQGNRMHKSE